ncbi:zf-TFIIB domain-containing protein [Nocardioides sp. LHG3406-4]|uniref:TFIIB-type zinc ribbon-containing protein n=1 Tax=Nocardioides sp. LHG3406-4 TaxID=2804575 RepID=UPI003CF291F5
MSCPRCGAEMVERPVGATQVSQCPEGHGVFLDRAELGTLVEAETDWHRNAAQQTAPLPRITPDMTAPPTAAKRARAWVETLFG